MAYYKAYISILIMTTTTLTQFLAENPDAVITDRDEETNLAIWSTKSVPGAKEESDAGKDRGMVFDGDKLVSKGLSKPNEITVPTCERYLDPPLSETVPSVKEKIEELKIINPRTFVAYEGAIIRVFCYNGKWYTSTNRKLDAFKSRWGGDDSFGKLFVDAIRKHNNTPFFQHGTRYGDVDAVPTRTNFIPDADTKDDESVLKDFYTLLRSDHQYHFLLRNTKDNRIVSPAPTDKDPSFYHVGTFKDFVSVDDLRFDWAMYPEERDYSYAEAIEHLACKKYFSVPYIQGLIIIGDNAQFKLYSSDYSYFFNLRGNEPSVKFRYLSLRMDEGDRNKFKMLYPEYIDEFNDYENILYKQARAIHEKYKARFIRHEYIRVDKTLFYIMTQCHNWHRTNKAYVTLETVIGVINDCNAVTLNKLIKLWKTEQHKIAREKRLFEEAVERNAALPEDAVPEAEESKE